MLVSQKTGSEVINFAYTAGGTQNIVTKTWVPEPGMTPKQIEKECQKQFVIFEEEVKTGSFVSANVKFSASNLRQ